MDYPELANTMHTEMEVSRSCRNVSSILVAGFRGLFILWVFASKGGNIRD